MATLKKATHQVIWNGGFKQNCFSVSEAMKIAKDLLNDYDRVEIVKLK